MGQNGAKKDTQKAFELAVKACDLGNMQSCHNVSLMYEKGDGVTKDLKKSQEYKDIVKDYQDQVSGRQPTIKMQGTS